MKSQLYELVQKSSNGAYPVKIETPTFTYSDDFDRSSNTHNIVCVSNIVIDSKSLIFRSAVFTNQKAANHDVCRIVYEHIEKLYASKSKSKSNNPNTATTTTPISVIPNIQKNGADIMQHANPDISMVRSERSEHTEHTEHTDRLVRPAVHAHPRPAYHKYPKPAKRAVQDMQMQIDDVIINKKLLVLIDYENVSNAQQLERLYNFLSKVTVYIDDDNDDVDDDKYEIMEADEMDADAEPIETLEPTVKPQPMPSIEIIKFAGHASTMKDTADIVVRSTRNDAVDHYIGFYLGMRIGTNPNLTKTHSIHILSRDKFASCLQDFCFAVIHNVDVDHLIETVTGLAINL